MNAYVFQSERLGFRNWETKDLSPMATLNNDDQVMKFFPFKPSEEDTRKFISRMQHMYTKRGFCYFAVDVLKTQEFIGFIGLSEQTYLPDLKIFVDIGWRLQKSAWGNGYATEGAKACLLYGFQTMDLTEIYSVASRINKKSIAVMKKIGMQRIKNFNHPKLVNSPELKSCELYQIRKL